MSDMQDKNTNNFSGFLKFLFCFIIICVCIFGLAKCIESQTTGNKKLFSRSARNDDLTFIDSNLDLGNLGAKFIFIPNTDISNLQITIKFLDKNRKILQTVEKSLGYVKKGVKDSFSISLFDFNITTVFKIEYTSWGVTGGTVSYFS